MRLLKVTRDWNRRDVFNRRKKSKKVFVLDNLKLFFMCGSAVISCFNPITQNGTNAGLIKQQFTVQTLVRFSNEKRVKNSESPLGLLYQLGRVGQKCQSSCRESLPGIRPPKTMALPGR
jgi:hypothetical protein